MKRRVLDAHRLERHLEAQMRREAVPGLAVSVVQNEDILYAGGFGLTSVEEGGVSVTPTTLFKIASTTKPLTGTAVMCLVDRGLLDLDRPVRKYLPYLRLREAEAADRVTLRMLLSHTAGLPTEYQPYGPSDSGALAAWVRRALPKYKLIAPPGTRYAYSNVGFKLAGYVVEVVAGKPFAAALQELLFDPLAMRHTTLDPTVAMTYPLALPHARHEPTGALAVVHRFPHNTLNGPPGGAMSTVLDLANFAVLHLNRGRFRGRQLLAPASVAAMHARHTATGEPDDPDAVDGRDRSDGYGLAFGTDIYKGTRIVEHDGEGDWHTTQLILAPDRGVGVIVLCNAYRAVFAAATANFLLDQALGVADG